MMNFWSTSLRFSVGLIVGVFLCLRIPNVQSEEVRSLGESDVIQIVLQGNRAGKIAKLEAAQKASQARAFRGQYDTYLQGNVSHEIDKSDRITSVFGTRNDTTRIGASLHRKFSTGTEASLGFSTGRQTSNSPFATIDPAHDAIWSLGFRQPLVRNHFGKADQKREESLDLFAQSEELQADRTIEEMVQYGIQSYWIWISHREDAVRAEDAVERAKAFLTIIQKKARFGTAEDKDIFAARANLASQEDELLASKEQVRLAEIDLKTNLLLPLSVRLIPNESLRAAEDELTLEYALQTAETMRRDLQAAEKRLSATKANVGASRSNQSMMVDLFASFELNDVSSSWPESIGAFFVSDKPKFLIGAEFQLPFENRARKEALISSQIDERKSQLWLEQMRDDVKRDVHSNWTSLESIRNRIKKIESVVFLEKKKLDAITRDYQRGRSDALSVILYQQDLIRAERRLISLLGQEAVYRAGLKNSIGMLVRVDEDPL